MNNYEITLKSKDGQRYVTNAKCNTKKAAIQLALDEVQLKGWDRFGYKFEKGKLL